MLFTIFYVFIYLFVKKEPSLLMGTYVQIKKGVGGGGGGGGDGMWWTTCDNKLDHINSQLGMGNWAM